jgi:hypothetical protein
MLVVHALADRKNKPRIRSAREYRIYSIGSQRLARLGLGRGQIREIDALFECDMTHPVGRCC